MMDTSYRMEPVDPQRRTQAIAQITADAFAGGQYVDEISRQYIGNCHYDWQTSRLIWDGDRLVHHSILAIPTAITSASCSSSARYLFTIDREAGLPGQ